MLKNGVNYFTEELHLTVPAQEFFDDETNTFFSVDEQTIRVKHSLISISKWEAKYKKQFLDGLNKKTQEEVNDYIRFMTITQNVDPSFYDRLSNEQLLMVNNYISETMSGTKIREPEGKGMGRLKPVSAEEIYYWMTEYNIPPEYAKWHLSKLLMLIRVCGIRKSASSKKNKKGNKGNNQDYRSLNNARKKKHHTRG